MIIPTAIVRPMRALAQESRAVRFFALFSLFHGLDLFAELKVIYLFQRTHSYALAADLIAVIVVVTAALEIPTGLFSDLVGRRGSLVMGLLCTVLSYVLFATQRTVWGLSTASCFYGAAQSFFNGNTTAYLHDLLGAQGNVAAYHRYYGKLQAVVSCAAIAGVVLGGLVANESIALFMWLNLVPQLLALGCALRLPRPAGHRLRETTISAHLRAAGRELRANMTLRYLSLAAIFGGAGAAAGELQAAAFSAVWPTWALGIAKGVQIGVVIPSYYCAGWIIDRLGFVRVITVNLVVSVAGNLLTGSIRSAVSPLFVMLSLPLYGADDVAEQTLFQREFTDRQRATIASMNSLGNSLYFAIILTVCGWIANRYGPFVALIATQVFLSPSMIFKGLLLHRIRNDAR